MVFHFFKKLLLSLLLIWNNLKEMFSYFGEAQGTGENMTHSYKRLKLVSPKLVESDVPSFPWQGTFPLVQLTSFSRCFCTSCRESKLSSKLKIQNMVGFFFFSPEGP